MTLKTIRIKKQFLEAIKRGDKRIEYRADKPYYEWLWTIEIPFKLKMHYQSDVYLIKTVKEVQYIKRPDHISPLNVPTPWCWALYF